MLGTDGLPVPRRIIDQDALSMPPRAPSDRVFICSAVVHVGRVTIPDWNDAELHGIVQLDHENVQATLVREAYDRLCQAIIDDEIDVYLRPVKGGALAKRSSEFLIADNLHPEILRSGTITERKSFAPNRAPADLDTGEFLRRIDPTGKYSLPNSLDFHYFAFVDRDQLLRKFPERSPVIAPAGMDPEVLSDYMRLALRTAADGYGATFSGEKKEIERALFERAGEYGLGGGALTDPVAKSIATILRNKEAQGGRAGPLRKKSGA